jgi:hypothetical protein
VHVYRLLMYCFARESSLHLRLVALPSPESLGNCNLVPTLEWNEQHSTFVFMRGCVIDVQFIEDFLLLGMPLH